LSSQVINSYRFAGVAGIEIVLDDDPASPYAWCDTAGCYAPTSSQDNNYNGVFINTNSAIKGKTLQKITAWLCKTGSPNTSGTIRLGVLSGTDSGSTITWVTDAYVDIQNDLSSLNTGFPAVAVAYTVTLPTPHVLQENDTIGLGLTGGNYDNSNNVAWQYTAGTNIYDAEHTSRNRYTNVTPPPNREWTGAGMTSDMHCTITVAE